MEHMERMFGSFMFSQISSIQSKGEGNNRNDEIGGDMNDEI